MTNPDLTYRPEYGSITAKPSAFVKADDSTPVMRYSVHSRLSDRKVDGFWSRSAAEFWLAVHSSVILSQRMRSR